MNKNTVRNCINKGENGITLIALIVSLMVLVILAGVTITTLTGDNGLLNKASLSKQKTDNAADAEKNKIDSYQDVMYDAIGERNISEDRINEIVDEKIDALRTEMNAKHTSFTSSLFTISYNSDSATLGAATRKIASFPNNITQATDIGDYFTYDSTNKKLVCQKEGYYVLNVSCRGCRQSDGGLEGYFEINNKTASWTDSWANGSNSEVWTGNMMTVYLYKDDTIDFGIYNGCRLNYYKLYFYVYAN